MLSRGSVVKQTMIGWVHTLGGTMSASGYMENLA